MNQYLAKTVRTLALMVSAGSVCTIADAQVGSLDVTFGLGGVEITDHGDYDQGRGVLSRPDETIFVGGYSGHSSSFSTYDSVVWSYQTNGSLIEASLFQSRPFGCPVVPDFFNTMNEDSSGRVLAAGWAQFDCGGQVLDFWVVRYDPGASAEIFEQPVFNGGTDLARAIIELSDGRVVAAGQARPSSVSTSWDMAFAGFEADGTLDTTGFGSNGETTIDMDGQDDIIFGLGELSDFRIMAVGFATIGGQRVAAIVRLNSDGTVDDTYGVGGVVTHDLGGSDAFLTAMVVLPDDSIVAVGERSGAEPEFVVAKFDSDGALDPLFGSGGVAVVDFAGAAESARSLRLQDDGKIVVAGYSESLPGGVLMRDFAVARLLPNGILDPVFGVDGRLAIDIVPGQEDWAVSLDLEPDGDVLVVGTTRDVSAFSDAVVVRLLGDLRGSPVFVSDFETGGLDEWAMAVTD